MIQQQRVFIEKREEQIPQFVSANGYRLGPGSDLRQVKKANAGASIS